MRVLLTGIGGFIGSHCLEYFLEKTDWDIVGIDSFRHKGTYTRVQEARRFIESDRLTIFKHDLTAPIDQQLENLLVNYDGGIDIVINMASNSAVERSVANPVDCIKNNVDLAINMLEFSRIAKPDIFFQISTDEVYGEAKSKKGHWEWDAILPSNPYAASKAAQEAIAISYWRTYDVPVVITNTMNNIGERQDSEKFLPKIISFIAQDKTVPIYGESGKIGSRCYMHAKNHADALIFLANQKPARYIEGAKEPDRYNVCGDIELNNLELAQLVAEIMGKTLKYELIPSESARKGYDRRYALNGAKLRDLGWQAPISFRESLERIVKWSLQNPHWLL